MSKEDLDDADLVDDFAIEYLEDYFDFLFNRFDKQAMRKEFCIKNNNKFLEFKSKREEAIFDKMIDNQNDDLKIKH